MILRKDKSNICILIPFSRPNRSLCGTVKRAFPDRAIVGEAEDATCPECLRIYRWCKTGVWAK